MWALVAVPKCELEEKLAEEKASHGHEMREKLEHSDPETFDRVTQNCYLPRRKSEKSIADNG